MSVSPHTASLAGAAGSGLGEALLHHFDRTGSS
jgi:hypothetical protein